VKRRVDLLMFDLDGTLADTGLDIANAVNHMRRRLELDPLDEPAVYAQVGKGLDHLIRATLPDGLHGRFIDARRLFLDHYRSHLLDNTRLYPHADQILEYFGKQKKAVITNKLHALTVSILEGLGVAARFHLILGGDSTAQKKPHPEPLRQALAKFAVEPSHALIVGDDAGDILAGRAAGVRTCGVTYGIGNREALIQSRPDHVIGDLLELQDHYE
jgi:phosphoglycolate phosphatase